MDKLTNYNRIGSLELQRLVEHVNAGVVIHAHDSTILVANQKACRLLGLTVSQLLGKTAIDPAWYFVRMDGSRLPMEEYPVEKVIHTLQPFEHYIIGINKPNSDDRVWVEVNAYPELNKEQTLSHVVVTFVDITAQVETQKDLAASEASFLRIFQDSPGIMLITSVKDDKVLATNNKIIQTGYSREEIIGRSVRGIKFWDNLTQFDTYCINLEREGKVENFEARFRLKNGEIATCLVSGEKIRFQNQDCHINIFIDISERKKSENQLNILYEIVQGVLNTSDLHELLQLIHASLKKIMYAENCFFALYDESTKLFSFPYYSDQYDDGFHPQEMLKSCTSYVYHSGESLLITPEIFQKLKDDDEIELLGPASPSWMGIPLKTSTRTIGVMVLQHYTETAIFNEWHVKFLDSIGSQVANVIERKRAENELEKSHSLIAATLESTADGILVVDKNGKITNYNRKFLELWHIPDTIIASKNDEELLSYVIEQLVDPQGFIDKVEDLYLHDEQTSTDYLEFKDGRIFKRYSQSQQLDNKSIGRVWSFLDMTSQVETLKALHESENRLHELNATKDKFFSIIAHDLKSPFSGILGFSTILAEQIRQKDYENIEEYAEIIQYSAQRAFDLLTNLMEWSSAQSGRLEFDPQMIDTSALIQEVIDLVKITALQKSILITKKIERSTMASIDKKMISSVLRNIITNAIKFTHPGGSIEVRMDGSETELKIAVKDNGVGIEPGELMRLFKIDQSFSVPGTQNEKGTGLGLILCKEFIDKHGGKIWAESEPGVGSIFCFTIPITN